MSVFVVFRVQDPTKIAAAIAREYPNDHLPVGHNEWLISATSTAVDVATKLGVSKGESGAAMIFAMSSYYGRATTAIWDWIKAKAEQPNG